MISANDLYKICSSNIINEYVNKVAENMEYNLELKLLESAYQKNVKDMFSIESLIDERVEKEAEFLKNIGRLDDALALILVKLDKNEYNAAKDSKYIYISWDKKETVPSRNLEDIKEG
jgi:hypothetical protein